MKRQTTNILLAWSAAALLALDLTSCINDESTYADPTTLHTLTIGGSDDTTMPTYNFDLGNDITINPEIAYDGDEADLTYKWEMGTYTNGVRGELKEVGTERNLRIWLDTGGAYYFHFTVTDGKVGKAINYKVNLNRTFEEGYLLTSSDADGKGNLTFIKIPTPEETAAGKETAPIEHCLHLMNENVSEDDLVKAFCGEVNLWDGKNLSVLKRVLVSTAEGCYFLDPNNFTVLSYTDYSSVFPGFRATEFMPDSYTPYAYDKNMKKFVHINLKYIFPYEYSYYKGFKTDDCVLTNYLLYGNATTRTFYLDYAANKVSIFCERRESFGLDTDFPDTGTLLDGQKLITVFGSGTGSTVYIMASNNMTGDINMWSNSSKYNKYYLKDTEFSGQSFTPTADTAVPAQGTRFTCSPTYDRYFYSVGNSVYVYLASNKFTLPDKSQYAIRFGDGEEVTFLEVNISTNELFVGTYDKTSRRGSFYIYDCKDVRTDNSASVTPKKAYKDCCGKITYAIYKPSIQNS